MNKIKFGHDDYFKFEMANSHIDNKDIVELIGVSICHIDKLSEQFKKFDTSYGNPNWESEIEYYPLPKGMVIVLFFWSDGIFPTIRRWNPQKEEYYKSKIGSEFEVVITR